MDSGRFAVDFMLGRLARWLRALGHDVAWGPHLRRQTLERCARREHRLLLTRDTHLVRRRELPPHLFITSDRFRDQLRQVAAAVPLGGGAPLSRCLDCNRPLSAVSAETVRDRVPAYVLATQHCFLECPRCHRTFWGATHRANMLAELAALGLVGTEGDGHVGV